MPEKKSAVTRKRVSKTTTRAAVKDSGDAPRMNNESAILVSLAYLIGFVTAYIAFAVNQTVPNYESFVFERHPATYEQLAASGSVHAFSNEEGFFVSNRGTERIVSAKTEEADNKPGYHRQVLAAKVSAKGDFVHYCAVMTVDNGRCSHFVYVVGEDKVYRVLQRAVPLDTSVAEAAAASWDDTHSLRIGSLVSVNAATPWILE